jgi:hypothetical protein
MNWKEDVEIVIRRGALEAIFDECDRYDHDETGGRLIGKLGSQNGTLTFELQGVIEPGPKTERTSSSLFQDGEYQEKVFRDIEQQNPEIEHLGNWHTHHVNGYPTLSSGDKATYHRIVNHSLHNIDFFYALLVTNKRSRVEGPRYDVRHFIFKRGQQNEIEVSPDRITFSDDACLWPKTSDDQSAETGGRDVQVTRAWDYQLISRMYPDLKLFQNRNGLIYWKGVVQLSDSSQVSLAVVEDANGELPSYTPMLIDPEGHYTSVAKGLAQLSLPTGIEACGMAERKLNEAVAADHFRKRAER